MERFWEDGYSLLIYQHFPHVKRGPFILDKANQLLAKTGASEVISFRTSQVVFLLVPQEDRLDFYGRRCRVVDKSWSKQIQVAHYLS
jgi:hypothetical protein